MRTSPSYAYVLNRCATDQYFYILLRFVNTKVSKEKLLPGSIGWVNQVTLRNYKHAFKNGEKKIIHHVTNFEGIFEGYPIDLCSCFIYIIFN